MKRVPEFLPACIAAALLVLVSAPLHASPPAAPTVLAGVAYDPAAPLNAVVKALGNQSAGAARTFSVRYGGARNERVPGLLMLPTAGSAAPPACVLLVHGIGGSKGDLLLASVALARRGYASLAVDIAGHGERPRIGGKAVADLSLHEMRRLGAQTIVDLRRAVDFLQTRPEVDASRIGLVGVSLGGILGGVFAAVEPRVDAPVLWAAGGDWGTLITTSTHPFARRFRARGTQNAVAIRAVMADVDPARYAARIAPRSLLLLNGASDTVVPRACADALFQAAREPKRREILPGGHVSDPLALLDRTVRWFNENLQKR